MKARIWLRAAAVLQVIFAFGHTVGGTPRKAIRGPEEAALFSSMQSFHFEVMGANRSHWDFYQGFGLTIGVNLAVLAVLMWQLSRVEPRQARPLVMTLLISEIMIAILSCVYFFAGPIVTSILISLCLAMAVRALYQEDQASPATAVRSKAG